MSDIEAVYEDAVGGAAEERAMDVDDVSVDAVEEGAEEGAEESAEEGAEESAEEGAEEGAEKGAVPKGAFMKDVLKALAALGVNGITPGDTFADYAECMSVLYTSGRYNYDVFCACAKCDKRSCSTMLQQVVQFVVPASAAHLFAPFEGAHIVRRNSMMQRLRANCVVCTELQAPGAHTCTRTLHSYAVLLMDSEHHAALFGVPFMQPLARLWMAMSALAARTDIYIAMPRKAHRSLEAVVHYADAEEGSGFYCVPAHISAAHVFACVALVRGVLKLPRFFWPDAAPKELCEKLRAEEARARLMSPGGFARFLVANPHLCQWYAKDGVSMPFDTVFYEAVGAMRNVLSEDTVVRLGVSSQLGGSLSRRARHVTLERLAPGMRAFVETAAAWLSGLREAIRAKKLPSKTARAVRCPKSCLLTPAQRKALFEAPSAPRRTSRKRPRAPPDAAVCIAVSVPRPKKRARMPPAPKRAATRAVASKRPPTKPAPVVYRPPPPPPAAPPAAAGIPPVFDATERAFVAEQLGQRLSQLLAMPAAARVDLLRRMADGLADARMRECMRKWYLFLQPPRAAAPATSAPAAPAAAAPAAAASGDSASEASGDASSEEANDAYVGYG